MTSTSSVGRRAVICSSTSTATSTAPRATCRPRSTRRGYLPANLPSNPTYRKVNPGRRADHDPGADLGTMTTCRSTTRRPPSAARRRGRGRRPGGQVGGSSLPAVRVESTRAALILHQRGSARTCARGQAPTPTPEGAVDDGGSAGRDLRQRPAPPSRGLPPVGSRPIATAPARRLGDVAEVDDSVEDLRNPAAMANGGRRCCGHLAQPARTSSTPSTACVEPLLPQLADIPAARSTSP